MGSLQDQLQDHLREKRPPAVAEGPREAQDGPGTDRARGAARVGARPRRPSPPSLRAGFDPVNVHARSFVVTLDPGRSQRPSPRDVTVADPTPGASNRAAIRGRVVPLEPEEHQQCAREQQARRWLQRTRASPENAKPRPTPNPAIASPAFRRGWTRRKSTTSTSEPPSICLQDSAWAAGWRHGEALSERFDVVTRAATCVLAFAPHYRRLPGSVARSDRGAIKASGPRN